MATVTIEKSPQVFDVLPYHQNTAVHNFSSHTIKAALSNTAPLKNLETLSQITQISGGGYTSGGYAVTVSLVTKQEGTSEVVLADTTITAGSGGTGNFRYVVIYNDTPTSPADPLVMFFDLGAEYSLAQGQTLNLDFSEYALKISYTAE
jgi:hypothetical protein